MYRSALSLKFVEFQVQIKQVGEPDFLGGAYGNIYRRFYPSSKPDAL
jgi:hypothetical protein